MLELLNKLQVSSSPGALNIPGRVIKICAESIALLLAILFNFCIDKTTLPDECKQAIVTPLFNGKGSAEFRDNYRGINILSPIAKIIERIIAILVMSFFDDNNLFSENQHGFRSKNSCETALQTIVDKRKEQISDKKIVASLFIDFRKAFDLINPKLLFRKLFHYGFSNKAIKFFTDYFTNRKQITRVNTETSDELSLDIGVPLGSVLGPILILIYINDLSLSIDLSNTLFADDTTISIFGNIQ